MRIWGKGWPDLGPHARVETEPVWGLKKVKIYKASRINLNIQGTALQISGVSERVFEIMACGGFVLSKSYPDLLTLFARSGGVDVFSDADDLRKKIGYYLAHDDERRDMSARARALVSTAHTYRHRVVQLLEAVSA
jgi:spore maturation protein CgeB